MWHQVVEALWVLVIVGFAFEVVILAGGLWLMWCGFKALRRKGLW